MKIFDLTKEEVNSIKKRQIVIMILIAVLTFVIIGVFLIIATRKYFLLFLLLSILVTFVGTIFFLYFLLGKLKSTNSYLLILKKSENSKLVDKYTFIKADDEIQVKDGLSYYRYFFAKEDKEYVFYVLFDKHIALDTEVKVKITSIDNIALEMEVLNEKD